MNECMCVNACALPSVDDALDAPVDRKPDTIAKLAVGIYMYM
jgi:hypothetical protein